MKLLIEVLGASALLLGAYGWILCLVASRADKRAPKPSARNSTSYYYDGEAIDPYTGH